MPRVSGRITQTMAAGLPEPEAGQPSQIIYWDPTAPGLGLRVTRGGARSWVLERRVDGKTVRRTLGALEGRGAITATAARSLVLTRSSELAQGIDHAAVVRAKRQAARVEATVDELTVEKALRAYVKGKRRAKDGLPLKARTVDDYLGLVEPGRLLKNGRQSRDGALVALADRPLAKLTPDEIRKAHADAAKRSRRQADYAMQVLRAVLRWHGEIGPGNPLHRDTAGKERITIAPSRGNPRPIPPDALGRWWNAAVALSTPTADMLRFVLLTGCRGIEVHGSAKYGYPPIRVRDVDLVAGVIALEDTKNRQAHEVALSRQALAIVEARCEGRKPGDPVFPVEDGRKTLAAINAEAGTTVTGHGLRSTFASIAEDLVSAGTLRRMLNHARSVSADVTQTSYVSKSRDQLRAGWQAVADFVEGAGQAAKGAEE